MALFKATLLIQLTTNAGQNAVRASRTAGWSESWYYTGTFEGCRNAIATGSACLGATRALLLPTGASVVGYRIQSLNVNGLPLTSRSFNYSWPGLSYLQCDTPQNGLLIGCPTSDANTIKRVAYRGVPDARIVNGEYEPAVAFTNAFSDHAAVLSQFQVRAKTKTNPKIAITQVSDAGIVTTQFAHGLVAGDQVQLGRVVIVGGQKVAAMRRAISPITENTFKIDPWTYGIGLGGYSQKYQITYVNVIGADCYIDRATVRKVGRPFNQFVGAQKRR